MSAMKVTDFMLNLSSDLVEKKKVTDSTASTYIKSLYALNNKESFKNLTFLKKGEDIVKKIETYSPNTQKALYATLASVLSLFADRPGFKKIHQFYYDKMMEKSKVANDTSDKTTKQEKNWIEWDEVQKKYNELCANLAKDKKPTLEHLLPVVVLGLYVEIPPRRNQDYLQMRVIRLTPKQKSDTLSKEFNYCVLRKSVPTEFIFNKYKTSKTYGSQTIVIPATLSETIKKYIKVHPLTKEKEFSFLVGVDGTPITADNSITRILNKIFGKNVGSSMLRHIYLSSKYDINSMKSDAEGMAHSLSQQKDYLKGSAQKVSLHPVVSSSPPSHSGSDSED